MKKIFIVIYGLLLFTHPVTAAPKHGLSLYGPQDLKYNPSQSYDYANPNAPKGGNLVLADFGAFTKLNPASLKGVTAPGIGQLVFQRAMDSSIDDNEPFSQYGNLVEKTEVATSVFSTRFPYCENGSLSSIELSIALWNTSCPIPGAVTPFREAGLSFVNAPKSASTRFPPFGAFGLA